MNKKIRLKRLEQLHYMLKNHDKLFKTIKFDLNQWTEECVPDEVCSPTHEGATNSPLSCTTAACALGSAAMYEPFRKQGLKTDVRSQIAEDGVTQLYYPGNPVYKDQDGMEAGATFFGITYGEAYWLFSAETYFKPTNSGLQELQYAKAGTITPDMVAKRVRHIIKHYSKTNEPMLYSADYPEDNLPYDYKIMGVAA